MRNYNFFSMNLELPIFIMITCNLQLSFDFFLLFFILFIKCWSFDWMFGIVHGFQVIIFHQYQSTHLTFYSEVFRSFSSCRIFLKKVFGISWYAKKIHETFLSIVLIQVSINFIVTLREIRGFKFESSYRGRTQ